MKTILSFFLFLAGLVLSSCSSDVRTDGCGITVRVAASATGGPRLVRIQVVGDKLIHVSATPERHFRDPQSLVVLPVAERPVFDVFRAGDTVSVVTSALKTYVLVSTGEIWFSDHDGRILLQEQKGGGKTFEQIEVDAAKGLSLRSLNPRKMNHSTVLASIRQTNSTTKEGTNSFSNTIPRSPYLSWFPARGMESLWTATP